MNGRYNRLAYVLRLVIFAVVAGVLTGIGQQMGQGAGSAIAALGGLTYAVAHFVVTIKRLHDIERPGWHIVLLAVPFYNLYLSLVLLFKQGTQGPNAYGPDPLMPKATAALAA